MEYIPVACVSGKQIHGVNVAADKYAMVNFKH